MEPNGGQWIRSKSFDSFLPIGPAFTPASAVPNPQDLIITTRLNGKVALPSS